MRDSVIKKFKKRQKGNEFKKNTIYLIAYDNIKFISINVNHRDSAV